MSAEDKTKPHRIILKKGLGLPEMHLGDRISITEKSTDNQKIYKIICLGESDNEIIVDMKLITDN